MEQTGKKVYTVEEIKKLVPRYKGKPESFDPEKAKAGRSTQNSPKSPSKMEQTDMKVYTFQEIKKLVPRYKGKPESFDPEKAKAGRSTQNSPKSPYKMEQTDMKVYTVEEIKKLVPRYKGKPESFDPLKAKAGRSTQTPHKLPVPKTGPGPASPELTPPSHVHSAKTPTPEENQTLLSDSIFGKNIEIFPINPRQNVYDNLAKLPDLARETYCSFAHDVEMLDRLITEEEFVYYSTALMWLRLIEVKAKNQSLTSEEESIQDATQDVEFNIPEPIYIYLASIGDIKDAGGQPAELLVPDLPIQVAGNLGGYHAVEVNLESHNLFEEVPCLGITADAVMALQAKDLIPDYRIKLPPGAKLTSNLCGHAGPIATPKDDVKERLKGHGITATTFCEYVQNTRFNLKYLREISDIIEKFPTFEMMKLNIASMMKYGNETQIIKTVPQTQPAGRCDKWTDIIVVSLSAFTNSTNYIEASFVFGFQLHKEPGQGTTQTECNRSWSCIDSESEAAKPWVMDDKWFNSRNARRTLLDVLGGMRYRGLYNEPQRQILEDVVRRLIKVIR